MGVNQLGSEAALGLAGIAVTGVVAAAVFAYNKFEEYEEKKHKKLIDDVIECYEENLANIPIPGNSQIIHLPLIFNPSTDKGLLSFESAHLTEQMVNAMGKIPHGADKILSMYHHEIQNVIAALREYYLDRESKNDVKARVLSYLLYVIDTNCMQFQGWDLDIAIIEALAKFINAYASKKEKKNTNRFTHLEPVYHHLLLAKKALAIHRDKLSLSELVSELESVCSDGSISLIKTLTQMTIPAPHRKYVDNVSLENLSRGILRRRFVKKVILKQAIHQEAIKIPNSIFKNWIKSLSDYYLKTLDPNAKLTNKDILSPQQIFTYPDLNLLSSLEKTGQAKKEIQNIKDNIKAIRKVFDDSDMFLTREVKNDDASSIVLISIKDDKELIARVKIFADAAIVTHQIISLEDFSKELSKSEKQFGEMYVSNPHHFCKVFMMLDELCKLIKKNATKNRQDILAVQAASRNAMQLAKQEKLAAQLINQLETYAAGITKIEDKIHQQRIRAQANIDQADKEKESAVHSMYGLVDLLMNTYDLNVIIEKLLKNLYLSNTNENSKEEIKNESDTESLSMREPMEEVNEHEHEEIIAAEIIDPSVALLAEADEQTKKRAELGETLSFIYRRNLAIQAAEKPKEEDSNEKNEFNFKIIAYKNLLRALQELQKKCDDIIGEDKKDQARSEKADRMLDLALVLSDKTKTYLKADKDDRNKQAQIFSQEVHDLLKEKSEVINRHYKKLTKAASMLTLHEMSFFYTDTYAILSKVKLACDQIEILSRNDHNHLKRVVAHN